nr:hypothetical protein [Ophiocordyceps sp.]
MINNSDANFIKAFLTLCIFYFKFPLYGVFESINWQLLNEDWKNFKFSKHFCVENYLKYFTIWKIISFTISTLLGLGILKFLNLNINLIWVIGIIEIFVLFVGWGVAHACFECFITVFLLRNETTISIKLKFLRYKELMSSTTFACFKEHFLRTYMKFVMLLTKVCCAAKREACMPTLKSASAGGGWYSIIKEIEKDPKQNKPQLVVSSPELVDKYFLFETTAFMKLFKEENEKIAELLKKISDSDIDYSDKSHDLYFTFLQNHVNALNTSYSNRDGWVMLCAKYFSPEVKSKLIDMEANRENIRNNYLSKIEKLGYNKSSFREFITITNNYRNNLNKELNTAEELVHNNLRKTNIYRDPQVKKFVNSDYVEAKKIFKNQDTILKKKFEDQLFKN